MHFQTAILAGLTAAMAMATPGELLGSWKLAIVATDVPSQTNQRGPALLQERSYWRGGWHLLPRHLRHPYEGHARRRAQRRCKSERLRELLRSTS